MKIRCLLLCMILGGLLPPVEGDAQNTSQKIVNELYSIAVPSHWVSMEDTPGNGKTFGKRRTEKYNICYLGWRTPFETKEDLRIVFDIQSYQRRNKNPLTESDIEKLELDRLKGLKIEHFNKTTSKHKINFTLVKTASEKDGTIVAYRRFYMIQRNKDMVHRLMFSLPEVQYQKFRIDIQKTVDNILDSFTVAL